ncbi:MAG: 2OG-Fe(II) oxygenase [Leptothrix sp. (in: b-proteobacteria)]
MTKTSSSHVAPQAVTAELQRWIVDQARAGCAPDSVLQAMIDAGWQEGVAVQALEQTLTAHLAEIRADIRAEVHAQAQPAAAADALPPASVVPEPALADSPARLWAHDREVTVLTQVRVPRVVVFGAFLSDAECDALVALAQPRLVRSETVDNTTGGSEVNEARTSEGMFFNRGEHALIQAIEARIAALLDWPLENGEGLQVLHYRPGAQYKPHHDYFDPAQAGTPNILKRGGQRVATLVMYLNTPERGGGTTFPDVQLEVAPIKGNAVFFSYDRPHPSTLTLHGGAPVLAGEKWVATKWLREGRFD